jgi:hypothetical protein
MACEYGTNLSLAIQQTDNACKNLRKAVEEARKGDDPEPLSALLLTLSNQQGAVLDMTREQTRHQAVCDSCRSAQRD